MSAQRRATNPPQVSPPQPDEDADRLYRCIDRITHEPSACPPFKSSKHLAGLQVSCPTCDGTYVQPWPPYGSEAP